MVAHHIREEKKLRVPTTASPQSSGMLAFPTFRGFIWGTSDNEA